MTPRSEQGLRWWAPRPGWGAVLWLLFLYFPVRAQVEQQHPMAQDVVVGALLAVFAAVFVIAFVMPPPDGGTPGASSPAEPVLRSAWPVAAILALGLALAALIGWPSLPGFLIYASSTSAFRLPRRISIAVMGACVVAVGIVHVSTGVPWAEVGVFYVLVPLAWWGVDSTRRLIDRNREIERARDEVAALRVAAERERVARDVHDVLGHSLTVVAIKSQLAGRLLDPENRDVDRARAEIAEVEELARRALGDVRATVGGLRTPVLADEVAGVRQALAAAGVDCLVRGSVADVPEEQRALLAWALRESVTNVVRHSGATRCRIRLHASGIEVDDDGTGFDPDRVGSGSSGLAGLRERCRAAGTRLEVDSGRAVHDGHGTRIAVVLL